MRNNERLRDRETTGKEMLRDSFIRLGRNNGKMLHMYHC